MPIHLDLSVVVEYTHWERQKWHEWFQKQGDKTLEISVGPHGDGRFQTVGDLIRHIFGAEKRYIEWLSGRPLEQMTDLASIPTNSTEALFQFGQQSRKGLKEFLETFPAEDWDTLRDMKFPNSSLRARATPRKTVVHILLHEIRHWAQIGTLLRLNGLVDDLHDFIASPVMGGEWKREGKSPQARSPAGTGA